VGYGEVSREPNHQKPPALPNFCIRGYKLRTDFHMLDAPYVPSESRSWRNVKRRLQQAEINIDLPGYSLRKACIGSMEAARIAGMSVAIRPEISSNSATIRKVPASRCVSK
jgi:hypothetical protein